uniref:Large ribosomal subunit protein uL16m n=1 Tax=Coturnix japonica TaxID=93934 RepID=A0A8C2TMA6_COTJA
STRHFFPRCSQRQTLPWAQSSALLPASHHGHPFPPIPRPAGITIPERPKLKFMEKVPAVPKVKREPRQLRDIRGPSHVATDFTQGQYGILALGGGYLHWGHLEMIRLTIGRCMDPKNMFAIWRVPAPYKPLTKKSLGHRMGGGKGPIDRYVTAVKSGRLVVELGGRCEFEEVKPFLVQVAHKLPFPAIAVSRQSLQQMREEEKEKRLNNQNPWTFERVITANMLGMRRYLSPYDLKLKGHYWGKFFLQHRV